MRSGHQSRSRLRRHGVDFDQGVASSAIFAAHNCGGIAGRPRDDYGGFVVVGRRFPTRLNLGLLCILPVIVRRDLLAVSVKDGKNRIG